MAQVKMMKIFMAELYGCQAVTWHQRVEAGMAGCLAEKLRGNQIIEKSPSEPFTLCVPHERSP